MKPQARLISFPSKDESHIFDSRHLDEYILGTSNLSKEEPKNIFALTTNSSDQKVTTLEGYQDIRTLADNEYEETTKIDLANKELPMIEKQCNNIHNDTKSVNEKYGSWE